MIHTIKNSHYVMTSGEKYTAQVESYIQEEHYDSEENTYYTMYTPTVKFRTNSGKLVYESLAFSTSGQERDIYLVNYNSETGEIITLGYSIMLKSAGAFLF